MWVHRSLTFSCDLCICCGGGRMKEMSVIGLSAVIMWRILVNIWIFYSLHVWFYRRTVSPSDRWTDEVGVSSSCVSVSPWKDPTESTHPAKDDLISGTLDLQHTDSTHCMKYQQFLTQIVPNTELTKCYCFSSQILNTEIIYKAGYLERCSLWTQKKLEM